MGQDPIMSGAVQTQSCRAFYPANTKEDCPDLPQCNRKQSDPGTLPSSSSFGHVSILSNTTTLPHMTLASYLGVMAADRTTAFGGAAGVAFTRVGEGVMLFLIIPRFHKIHN